MPIEANKRGERMCVGRENELKTLINRIRTTPKIATKEGANGVGKTSLINVAAYRMFMDDLTRATEELWFVVLAVFGLQLAINYGGPEIEGYIQWLAAQDGISPLYGNKNTHKAGSA